MSIGILLFDAADYMDEGAPQRLYDLMSGKRLPEPVTSDDRFIMAVYSSKGFGIPVPDITYDEIRSDLSWVEAVRDQMFAMNHYDGPSSASLRSAIVNVYGVTGMVEGWLALVGFDLARRPDLLGELRAEVPRGISLAIFPHDLLAVLPSASVESPQAVSPTRQSTPTTTNDPDPVSRPTCRLVPTADVPTAPKASETRHESSVSDDGPEEYYRRGEQARQAKDFKTAAEWYELAAIAGLVKAQIRAGDNCMFGVGVPKDEQKARTWYHEAAEQGDLVAQMRLAEALSHDDATQAVYWYRKAAKQGSASAMFSLGVQYEKGEGVGKNYGLAAYWYRSATEQGKGIPQCHAACCLGDMYLKYRDAKGWKTDERQNPFRQWAYEHGEDARKDAEQAAYWYEMSIKLTPSDNDNASYVKDYKLKPLMDRYHFTTLTQHP